MKRELIQKIAVTYEIVNGGLLSEGAAELLIHDLEQYDEEAVSDALDRCRRECRGRLCEAEIISRIDNGWPSADEAWALVPKSENESCVWCDEIACAWSAVAKLYHGEWCPDSHRYFNGDHVAARISFKEIYERSMIDARDNHRRPRWWLSRGLSSADVPRVLHEAIHRGRMSLRDARNHIPDLAAPKSDRTVKISASKVIERLSAKMTLDTV